MRFLAPLLAASLAFSQAAWAVSDCVQPQDRAAFEVEGLKSQLMVAALACKEQPQYNAFMGRYRPNIASQEAGLNGYFKRVYGRKYEKSYDDYISNLANVQEEDGLKAGNQFCFIISDMFDEVMSLHDASELDAFANSQAIMQPTSFESCAISTKPVAKSRVRTSHHRKTKHS